MDCYGHENNTLHKLKMDTWLHCKCLVSLNRWSMLKCNAFLLACVVLRYATVDCFDGLSKRLFADRWPFCATAFFKKVACVTTLAFTLLLPFSCSLLGFQPTTMKKVKMVISQISPRGRIHILVLVSLSFSPPLFPAFHYYRLAHYRII